MHRGYVKLWRKFKDGELWKERRVFSRWEAWIDILTEANHKKEIVLIGNKTILCDRGQCVKSLETWMKRWNWGSKKRVRCFIDLLVKVKKVVKENVTVTTRLTVCNYNKYQDAGNEKGHGEGTQRAPNKNDKNIYMSFKHLKITFDEKEKLLKDGYTENEINDVILSIKNYRKNTNYNSLYLTTLNWLKKRKQNSVKKKQVAL